ncbi:hypothetical protein IAT40_005974 [Kwoniella sp. CBS 6097]
MAIAFLLVLQDLVIAILDILPQPKFTFSEREDAERSIKKYVKRLVERYELKDDGLPPDMEPDAIYGAVAESSEGEDDSKSDEDRTNDAEGEGTAREHAGQDEDSDEREIDFEKYLVLGIFGPLDLTDPLMAAWGLGASLDGTRHIDYDDDLIPEGLLSKDGWLNEASDG